MQQRVIAWPRAFKRAVVVALDVVMALFATWVAFTLRLDTLHWPSGAQWWMYVLAPVLAVPIFVRFGLYRAIFRYTGQAALQATGKAVLVYAMVLLGLLLWQRWPGVPRSLGVLQPLIFLLLVGASRAVARFWLADLGNARKYAEGRLPPARFSPLPASTACHAVLPVVKSTAIVRSSASRAVLRFNAARRSPE